MTKFQTLHTIEYHQSAIVLYLLDYRRSLGIGFGFSFDYKERLPQK